MTTIDDPPPATGPTEARTESAVALAGRIVHEVERAVIGKRDVVDLVLASVLAGGHVLLEDVPGVAKTLLEIGGASCRDRVWQYVSISVVAASLKKKPDRAIELTAY